MKKHGLIICLLLMIAAIGEFHELFAEVTVKVRDLTYLDGYKENQIIGYGLVVGLQGTGDSAKTEVASSSLKNLLKNLGMESGDLKSKNSAAVVITAMLPVHVRVGDRIDIMVSSVGDAKSLDGGILVQSSLKGADNQVYAVAQGPLLVESSGSGKSVKTVARIKGGGMIERAINPGIGGDTVALVLKDWDYTVATAIIKAIEKKFPASKPKIAEGGKVQLAVVKEVPFHEFIATIEALEVAPAARARVVIRERDGTVVAGGEVKLSNAMVSREGVSVEIKGSDKKMNVAEIKESATVKELVDTLNAVGAPTRDIIIILKALHDAGALHAELVIK